MKSIFALMRNAIPVVVLIASSITLTPGQVPSPNVSHVEPFEFHSGFWINLHHFLYEQALLRKQAASPGQTANKSEGLMGQLTADERQRWDSALDYYTKAMIKRDFVSDEGMITINDQLGEAEGAPDLSRTGLTSDLIKILESVAPVYRARWWAQHDRANRFWIAVVTPMVQQFNRTLINQLTASYKAEWPTEKIRVDVVEYANWAGAFTTFGDGQKVHITVATDPGNQGFAALELLFHESSHWMVGPRNGAVARAIARECQARNKPVPNGLWHAIIFYTAGEFTRRNLSEYGVTDYVPIAYRGLYARAWPSFQRPLELYWQPYLEGKVDFDKAMSNLINAL